MSKKLLFVLPLFLAACQVVRVPITHMRAAEGSIPQDVSQIAILPYEYGDSLNPAFAYVKDRIPDEVAAKITNWGTYTVVERQKMAALMQESMLQSGYGMDDADMDKMAQVSAAQALVVGKVNSVTVEDMPSQREYRVMPGQQKDPDAAPSQPRTVLYDYLVRRVSLDVTSEMLHIGSKNKIVTDSFSFTYDSERDPGVNAQGGSQGQITESQVGYVQNQPARVPSVSDIVDRVARECAEKFLKKISAHPMNYSIALKTGSSPAMSEGMEWAKRNQYESAIGEFNKATAVQEDKAAAFFNIGVCHEALGHWNEAVHFYQQSDSHAPSSDAKDGIARVRMYHPGT